MMKPDVKFPFYAKASLIFIGLASFVFVLAISKQIIVPIIYAIIVSIVLSPVLNFFVKKGMNRVLAIAMILLMLIITTISIITLLSYQLMQFFDSFPLLVEKYHQMLDQLIAWTSDNFNISIRKINLWVKVKNTEFVNGSGTVISQTLIRTGNLLIVLVLIPVYVFMLLFYQPLLIEFIHKLFTATNQSGVNQVLTATKKIIQSYLVGLLMEAGIIAVFNSAALLIIGIDYAILLGVIGALVNVIPYVGGVIAFALPMLIAIATKDSSTYCLLVFVSYIVIQFIDNHYIIPKVVASKVKINAFISVVVVLVGGALWGIAGMFLAIPLTAVLKVIFDHVESLKPWGFLLGDTMPVTIFKLRFKTK